MKRIDKATNTKAISHERIHIIKKLLVKPRLTDTRIKLTNSVVIKLIDIANFNSFLSIFFTPIFK